MLDEFARRLSELMRLHSAQKKDIAEYLGVTYRQFHRYETGEGKPDYYGLLKLADFFNVSLDYLVGRTDDPTPPKRSSSSNEPGS